MEKKIKVVTSEMKANDDLYYKMQIEYEEMLEDITDLSCDEMFEMIQEVAMKEIILKCMEVRDIPYTAAKALLTLDCPLEYVYLNYIKTYYAFEDFYEFITHYGDVLYAAIDDVE